MFVADLTELRDLSRRKTLTIEEAIDHFDLSTRDLERAVTNKVVRVVVQRGQLMLLADSIRRHLSEITTKPEGGSGPNS